MHEIYVCEVIVGSPFEISNNGGLISGGFLSAMFVTPDAQGKGIGQQLMNKAKSLRRKLNLTVYRDNKKSIQFYRKCGFNPVKERVDEHTGHIEILMEYGS